VDIDRFRTLSACHQPLRPIALQVNTGSVDISHFTEAAMKHIEAKVSIKAAAG
jgi:hypothetical protein